MANNRDTDRDTSQIKCWCFQGATKDDVKTELKELLKLSWPVVFYQVLEFFLTVVTIMFCGHLGRTELAAAALGQSCIHAVCKAVIYGFTTACDTLFAQTYGSSNKLRVGALLQRSILTTASVLVICLGILVNARPLLLLLKQDPEVVRLAEVYIYIYFIGAPADYLAYILIKYLQAQNHMKPVVISMSITLVMTIVIHFVIVTVLRLDLRGAISAQVCSYYVLCILLLVFIKCNALYAETWAGWTLDCLQEWGIVLRLGIPGACMLCLEWWTFEIGFYVVGSEGTAEVGAHSVMFYFATLLWSFALGLGVGGSIHIGNSLGANKPQRAKIASVLLLVLGGTFGILCLVLCLSLKDVIGYVITNDRETLKLVSDVIVIVAFFEIFDQMNGVIGGTIRGTGHQLFGAVVNLLGYNGVGLTMSLVLVYVYDLSLRGFWSGLLVGMFVQNVCIVAYIFRLNWKAEAITALERAAVLPSWEQDANKSNMYGSTQESKYLKESSQPSVNSPNMIRKRAIEQQETSAQGRNDDDREHMSEWNNQHGRSNNKASSSISMHNLADEDYDKLGTSDTIELIKRDDDSVDTADTTTVRLTSTDAPILTENPLPLPQVIFRRVLALISCILWIAVCIVIRISLHDLTENKTGNSTLPVDALSVSFEDD